MLIKSILVVLFAITASLPPEKVMICVSRTSYAYHTHVCSGLARCTHEVRKVTLQEAKAAGYKACHICYSGASLLSAPVAREAVSGQCQAITKKGTRCSRRARSGGYCWQHGG